MNLLKLLVMMKEIRYGMVIASTLLVASWAVVNYPSVIEWCKNFWGQPILAIVLALGAMWSSKLQTKDWESKIDEALRTEPPKEGTQK